jgi:hypothetical protein
MAIDITKLILGILELVVSGTIIYLIPFVKQFIKSKLTERQYSDLEYFSSILVDAAEQKYVGSKMGKEKKEYVLNQLREKGFAVDEAELDAFIEAAVKRLKDAA